MAATPQMIKDFRDYLMKQDPNSVNQNGIRCGDAVKELDKLYKYAVIRERKKNLEKDFTDETEGT